MKLIPVYLDTLMHERRLSNAKLSLKCGVSAPRIGQIRSGRYIPYEGELDRIANALRVSDPETLLEPLEVTRHEGSAA